MAYDARTQDDLAKWWVTGTGSTVNRLSEIMDDMPDGPAIYHVGADDDWTQNGATDEWYVATATKPDDVAENLAGWRNMTGVADDSETGDGAGLNADEWCFDTDNNRVYIRLSDDSDPNDTDARKHYAWDGSGAGPAILGEYIEDYVYELYLKMEIGDGSTSTILAETNIIFFIHDSCCTANFQTVIEIKDNATGTFGEVDVVADKTGKNGCSFEWDNTSYRSGYLFECRGDLYLYDTKFKGCYASANGSSAIYRTGTVQRIWGCQLTGNLRLYQITSSCDLYNLNLTGSVDVGSLYNVAAVSDRIFINNSKTAFFVDDVVSLNISNAVVVNSPSHIIGTYDYSGTSNLTDIISNVWAIKWNGTPAGGIINRRHTCNIEVADKDGTLIDDVTVLCEDEADAEVFSELTGATDTGKIDEQSIIYQIFSYSGGAVTTTKSPHKFTLSKAGYETLVLENITVDEPIDWHLELQDEVVYPAEDDVEDGVNYGDGGSEYTGNVELPLETDVEDAVVYGANGTEFTGNFEAPSEDDVEDGIGYGSGGIEFEGNFEAPAEAYVKLGLGYGANGTEFTGILETQQLPLTVTTEQDGIFDLAVTVEDTIDVSVEVA